MRCCVSLLALAACAGIAHAQARVNVYVFDFSFSNRLPGLPIESDTFINAGDIVVWIPIHEFHNTVAAVGQDEYWNSPILDLTDTFEYQFTIPGTYAYYCEPHGWDNGDGTVGGMTGRIIVLPAPASIGAASLALFVCVRRRRATRG